MMRPPLIMRCTIARDQADVDELDAMDAGHDWQTLASSVPCYWWGQGGSMAPADVAIYELVSERILLDRSTDIRAGDRITRLVDAEGRVVWSAADEYRTVEHVTLERSHINCSLAYAAIGGGRA